MLDTGTGWNLGGWQIFDPGAVIEPALAGIKSERPVFVNRRYRALVSFNERGLLGDATDMPIEFLLDMILYHIEKFVVPGLRGIIENP